MNEIENQITKIHIIYEATEYIKGIPGSKLTQKYYEKLQKLIDKEMLKLIILLDLEKDE